MGGGKGETEIQPGPEFNELIRIAASEYEYYQREGIPAEDLAIERALNTEGREQSLLGVSSADIYQRFGEAEPQVLQALASRGAMPNSGAFRGNLEGFYRDRSYSLGQGAGTASLAALQDRAVNAQRLVNLGQGVANQAVEGIGSSASAAQRQAIMDARASAASRAATQQIIGTGVGLGLGALTSPTAGMNYSGYGSLYTAPYKDVAMGLSAPIPIGG